MIVGVSLTLFRFAVTLISSSIQKKHRSVYFETFLAKAH